MRIYVASSWRNPHQPQIVQVLLQAGHEVYDFRNPKPGDNGFHWSEIDSNWKDWSTSQYREGLEHPLAEEGFDEDYTAMTRAEGCVLVLPCGRSAHLEAGWFAGRDLPLFILLEKEGFEPELMYKLAWEITNDPDELLEAIEQTDGGYIASPLNSEEK